MRKIILACTLVITMPLWAEPSFQTAQQSFQENNYAQALQEYQALLPTATTDHLYTAQLRIIASQYMLGQYMNAAQSAFTFPLPTDPLWQARFLLYRIKVAQRVQRLYRGALPNETEDQADFSQFSPAQWQDKIDESFEKLWTLRTQLIQAPITQETLILELQNTDQQAIPTLFDFVVMQWKEHLVNKSPVTPLRTEETLTLDYKPAATTKSSIEKLEYILTIAAQLTGKNRANARIIWASDRLTLPFDYPTFFTTAHPEKAKQTAISLLQNLAGYGTTTPKNFLTKMTHWFKPSTTDQADYGQSYAAYKAALLLNEMQSYEEAAALCDWTVAQFTSNYYTQSCAQIAAEIRRPVLQIQNTPFTQDPAHTTLTFSARNIPTIYARIYTLTEKDLAQYNQVKKPTSWHYLTHLPSDQIDDLLARTPIFEQKQPISYEKPHTFTQETLTLQPLTQKGFYAVALSYQEQFDPQKAPVQAIILNHTDMALFVSTSIEDDPARYHTLQAHTYTPSVFRIHTLDLRTGQPLAQVPVQYITDWKGTQAQGTTDDNGILSLTRPIHVLGNNNSYFIVPKAQHQGSISFLTHAVYFSFSQPQLVKLYLESDRAIYRPGQTVLLALYGFQEEGRGLKTLPKNTPVSLTIRDANGKKILEKTLPLNAYGTAQLSFPLPEEGLLGEYSASASYKYQSRTAQAHYAFKVEEYKRPDYEVTLSQAATLQYNQTVHITGHARYYFGTPVEKATVQYQITRQYYRPLFWWWRSIPSQQPHLIASGQTTTDNNGDFSFTFTPLPGEDISWPSTFHITASVRDDSGRSIEASANYKASYKTIFFQPTFTKGFYQANTPSILANIQLTDVNGQPTTGKFNAEIVELENTYSADTQPSVWQANSLENWYSKNKEIRSVYSRSFMVTTSDALTLHAPALPEGIYKLKLTSKQADPVELIFLVASDQPALALPAIAIAQEKTYYPGSIARILIGAQALHGPKRVEIYNQGQFLAHTERITDGVSMYQLPIDSAWRGGVYIRWFGASDYKTFQANTFIDIPHDNQNLSLTMTVPNQVKPGQPVSWTLHAKDSANNLVNGQATVRVYDKSLDYYAPISPVLSFNKLYPTPSLHAGLTASDFTVYPQEAYHHTDSHAFLETPQMPRLNLQEHYGFYATRSVKALGAAAPMAKMALQTNRIALTNMMDMAAPEAAMSADSLEAEEKSAQVDKTPRTDFSETAYFNAALPVQGGKGLFSFKMPQSLTTWNIQAFVLTPNVKFGTYQGQTITQKDVMLRLSLPRFWREQDHSTLVVQVTNTSAKKRNAEITLDILMDGKNAITDFGIQKNTQTLSIPPKSTTAASWQITAPNTLGLVQITATVHADTDTDAESKTIPILPASARVAESTTVALEQGSKTLQLDNLLLADSSRHLERMSLRLDPGLLLHVFNAMPQLLRPGYEDALSLINRYAPLAVVHGLYQTYPLLQDAVGHLPKRNTQLPVWDIQDPSRLLLLTQTPWLQTAQGSTKREQFLADLFNPASVSQARTQTEKKLLSYQTDAGGFSWMPGGEPSEFITLQILAAYSQILRYGGTISSGTAQKALAWLSARIEENLKQATPSASTVSYALYAAYVYTAFAQEWKEIKQAPISKWLAYADQHRKWMTPLGQTYAAAAYYRLGKNQIAQNYMDLVLSRLKTDPVTGAYFAPEAQSWIWYNDTLTTQTATLRTLMEIRPQATQAQELVKWLLFNRKAQSWQDSTATAETVYALLDYMQRRGLLDDPADYTVSWGNTTHKLHIEPFDFTEQLTWTKTAPDITPADYKARINKQGGLTGFATLDAIYTTAQAKNSPDGVLSVSRRYLLKYTEDGREKVRALQAAEEIPVGSEIEVELTLNASSAFDFVLLTDPKPSGFENTDLLSGWTWKTLSMYREVRDGATNFFINRIPAGTYTLRYSLRPTLAGQYHALPAQVQSMYAPQFSAHTAAQSLAVK